MALIYKCDRCGLCMENSYEDGVNNIINRVFYISNSKMDDDQDHLDLCSDCYKSFAEWWNGGSYKYSVVYPFIKEINNENSK